MRTPAIAWTNVGVGIGTIHARIPSRAMTLPTTLFFLWLIAVIGLTRTREDYEWKLK
jgi:hypothetical protein